MTVRRPLVAVLGAAALTASLSFALAGGHSPVEQREAAMKTVGQSAQTIGSMLRGEAPFDAAAANLALASMQGAVASFGDLFPEGTEGAGENENAAGPAIWTDRAGFDAAIVAFRADIDAAVAAAPQDQQALGAVFGEVAQNCRACHETYRIMK